MTDLPPNVENRLDAIMSALVHCRGASCRSPYSQLHPDGNVRTFEQAMSAEYDVQYSGYRKFYFTECLKGYFPSQEVTHWTVVA